MSTPKNLPGTRKKLDSLCFFQKHPINLQPPACTLNNPAFLVNVWHGSWKNYPLLGGSHSANRWQFWGNSLKKVHCLGWFCFLSPVWWTPVLIRHPTETSPFWFVDAHRVLWGTYSPTDCWGGFAFRLRCWNVAWLSTTPPPNPSAVRVIFCKAPARRVCLQ